MSKFEYNKNASKLHISVGDCLRASKAFGNQEIHQEYPVNLVNKDYSSGAHRFDWVIPKLKIVIECHGKQHYVPTAFNGDYEDAVSSFADLKIRDRTKKEAALAAGFSYIEVPYTAARWVSEELLLDLLSKAAVETEVYLEEHREEIDAVEEARKHELVTVLEAKKKAADKEKRQAFLKSDKHKQNLKIQREFRQKRYRRLKELKKNG